MADTPEERPSSLPLRLLVTFFGPMTRNNILGWVFLFGAIFFIKGCVVDQYTIPSESMEPTLMAGSYFMGDRVLVNKWIMGPRIPFTDIHLWEGVKPKRWDIMVFTPVEENSPYPRLIKRVVGLPGERIRLKLGFLEVEKDGEFRRIPFPEDMAERQIYYYNDYDVRWEAQEATDPQARADWGRLVQALDRYPLRYGVLPEEEFSVIPQGHYFMLGDNSPLSVDSRVYGWVPEKNFIGRACAILWPLPHRRDFTGFTYTWWGKGLIFGIPAGLVLIELGLFLRGRKQKTNAA